MASDFYISKDHLFWLDAFYVLSNCTSANAPVLGYDRLKGSESKFSLVPKRLNCILQVKNSILLKGELT